MKNIKIKPLSFFVLFPLFFHPLIFCPFSLPFVFCAACPIRCIQGRFKWWIALGIVLINLRKRFFCATLCPCGTCQDTMSKIDVKKINLPHRINVVKYIIFIAVVLIVLFIERLLNLAGYGRLMLYLVGLVFLTSLFIFRPWCRLFCPIDTASGIVDKLKT